MKPEELENIRYLDGSYAHKVELEEKIMFSWLPQKHGRLLDVGCGAGNITLELKNRGFEAFGIDFSPAAIEQAQRRGIIAQICDTDKEGIPFDNEYFDVVWMGDIIEHVFDPIFLLKETFRTLKPDGILLLATPNVMTIKQRLIIAMTGRSPQTKAYRDWSFYKHHTIFSRELLEFMLMVADLKIERLWAKTQLPGFRDEIVFKNRLLVSWLGMVFIVKATKEIIAKG